MKPLMLVAALLGLAATSAAAQGFGMPVWNSPKGGTGITISGDVAMPGEDYGKGTAFGARGAVGLGNLTLGVGFTTWKPDGGTDSYASYGATGAFRVIGGSLMPVAVNLQLGLARVGEANLDPAATRIAAGAGVSAALPTPGLRIEPYLALTNRWTKYEGLDAESGLGWTIGANVDFGMLGFHVAYDSEDFFGQTINTIGLGAHVALRAPIGM